jgi:hypothetical protein
MKRLFFFIVLLCALAASASANTGKIAGRVVDEKGDGIYGACVLIVETQQGVSIQNLDGSYVIFGIPPGMYTAKISSVQYVTQTALNVSVDSGMTTTLNITLKEAVLQGTDCQNIWIKPDSGSAAAPDSMGKPAKKPSPRFNGSISDGCWGREQKRVERVNTIGVPAHILVQYKIPTRIRHR